MPLPPPPTRNPKHLKRSRQSDGIRAQTQIKTCLGRWMQTAEVFCPCSRLARQDPALIRRQPGVVFSPALDNAGQLLHEEVPFRGGQCWLNVLSQEPGQGSLGLPDIAHLQMQEKRWRDSSFVAPGPFSPFLQNSQVVFLSTPAELHVEAQGAAALWTPAALEFPFHNYPSARRGCFGTA